MDAALIQLDLDYLDVETNLARFERHLTNVDADLIVLPELCTSGYFFQSTGDVYQVAEEIPEGSSIQQFIQWAQALDSVMVAGIAEKDGEAIYNSAVVVTPEGWKGTYRKTHLYYEEKQHFEPGQQGFPVFDVTTRSGQEYRLGVMICFDWYFPESARSLALNGADVIAHPSNLVREGCPRAMPIRAQENHVFTLTANRIGHESNGREELTFIGNSLVCDPMGEVMAEGPREEEALIRATFDPHDARDRQITEHNDIFADRMPATYQH